MFAKYIIATCNIKYLVYNCVSLLNLLINFKNAKIKNKKQR